MCEARSHRLPGGRQRQGALAQLGDAEVEQQALAKGDAVALASDDPLVALETRIAGLAGAGHANPWGAAGSIARDAPPLAAAARSTLGWIRQGTDAVLLAPLSCGAESGVVGVVSSGNYKDEASLVAAAIVIDAFHVELGAPLLAECDVGPALRRALLRAHDGIVSISPTRVAPGRFGTVVGQRKDLRGIGASAAVVVALPGAAWLTSVGECSSWLVRDGAARRLNLIDTLANAKDYRARVAKVPTSGFEDAGSVVTRVLGMNEDVDPEIHITRLELRPGDRVVVGNEWYTEQLAAARRAPGPPADLCDELIAAADAADRCPPGGVLVIAR